MCAWLCSTAADLVVHLYNHRLVAGLCAAAVQNTTRGILLMSLPLRGNAAALPGL